VSPKAKDGRRFGDERGFSLIQFIIVVGIKRKGGGTATLAVTVNQPGTIDKAVNSNLTATTASSETVTSSGGANISYTVKSANNSTGKFPIQFTYSNCSPVTVYVTVVK
jgi:hypothetical protein